MAATPATIIGRSTGGLIALALAHHYPENVRALVLLEPAFFEIDPEAAAWADALRRRILEAAEDDPESASEFVIREALGVETWNSLPDDLRALFVAASPAVLAEMRGLRVLAVTQIYPGWHGIAHQTRTKGAPVGSVEAPDYPRRSESRIWAEW